MKFIKKIKIWHLFLACIVLFVVGIQSVRMNNLRMVELRQKVFEADKNGQEIKEAMVILQDYVSHHMGTTTQVPLKYSYERAAKAAIDKAQASNGQPANIFQNLPPECPKENGFYKITNPCVKAHVDKRLAELGGQGSSIPDLPNKQLYIFSFSAPILSLDIAGLSLVMSLLSGLSAVLASVAKFIRAEISYYKGDIEGL